MLLDYFGRKCKDPAGQAPGRVPTEGWSYWGVLDPEPDDPEPDEPEPLLPEPLEDPEPFLFLFFLCFPEEPESVPLPEVVLLEPLVADEPELPDPV